METTLSSQQVAPRAGTLVAPQDMQMFGIQLARFGLALTLVWIGAMKFTAYEAEAIRGLAAASPLMGWMYSLLSVQGVAALIGTVEIAMAGMIAMRSWSPRLSAVGSGLAVGMFVTTLSFMFSTPGVTEASLGGFPALSVVPGQFLLKDTVLLGVAVWLTGEAWGASRNDR